MRIWKAKVSEEFFTKPEKFFRNFRIFGTGRQILEFSGFIPPDRLTLRIYGSLLDVNHKLIVQVLGKLKMNALVMSQAPAPAGAKRKIGFPPEFSWNFMKKVKISE